MEEEGKLRSRKTPWPEWVIRKNVIGMDSGLLKNGIEDLRKNGEKQKENDQLNMGIKTRRHLLISFVSY